METEALPPIPTPPGQRWREFRIRAMPIMVFALVLLGLVATWSTFVQPVSVVGLVETNSIAVITTSAGLLTGLEVNRFDEVTNGQVLGQADKFDTLPISAVQPISTNP